MLDFVRLADDGRREAQSHLDMVSSRLERRGIRSRLVLVIATGADAVVRSCKRPVSLLPLRAEQARSEAKPSGVEP